MFLNTLSDTPNIDKCLSAENKELEVPETYDWRQQYPECVRPVQTTDLNCIGATYAMVGLSATEDRICTHSKEHVKLSLDEFLDCDT